MPRNRVLQIRPPETEPPESRGRLLTADQVAAECFHGHVKAQWVKRNVKPKVRLGHSTTLWYEADVLAWIEEHRQEGAA